MTDYINKFKAFTSPVQIIILNLIVFALIHIVGTFIGKETIVNLLALQSNFYDVLEKPWGLLTHFFTHYGIMHILGNMLIFYFSSSMIAGMWGNKHTWKLYIMAGLFSGIVSIIYYTIVGTHISMMIGASGAVAAFMMLAALLCPNVEVLLLFIPVKMKYLVAGYVFIDLFFLNSNDGTGHIAHLAGYVFGFIYFKYSKGINSVIPKFPKKSNTPKQHNLDTILDKISRYGMSSLSKDEKIFLNKIK